MIFGAIIYKYWYIVLFEIYIMVVLVNIFVMLFSIMFLYPEIFFYSSLLVFHV